MGRLDSKPSLGARLSSEDEKEWNWFSVIMLRQLKLSLIWARSPAHVGLEGHVTLAKMAENILTDAMLYKKWHLPRKYLLQL